jgi:hypothetical protein
MAINPVPEYSQADGNYIQDLGELGGAWMAPKIREVPWKLIVGAAVALLIVIAATVLLFGSWSSSAPSLAPKVAGTMAAPVTTPSPCLVADTAGGTPCTHQVDLGKKGGTLCFMPHGGYGPGITCTWRISCEFKIAPVFNLTQLQTEIQFDAVQLFDGDGTEGEPLARLSGVLADQRQREFEADGTTMTIAVSTDDGHAAAGFAGTYSCLDHCRHPTRVECGQHGLCKHGAGATAGVCVCSDGYYGASCQTAPDRCEYPQHVSCGSHGSCSDGHCTCTGRYNGSSCTVAPKKCCSDDDYYHGCCCYIGCGGRTRAGGCGAAAYCDENNAGWDADCDHSC